MAIAISLLPESVVEWLANVHIQLLRGENPPERPHHRAPRVVKRQEQSSTPVTTGRPYLEIRIVFLKLNWFQILGSTWSKGLERVVESPVQIVGDYKYSRHFGVVMGVALKYLVERRARGEYFPTNFLFHPPSTRQPQASLGHYTFASSVEPLTLLSNLAFQPCLFRRHQGLLRIDGSDLDLMDRQRFFLKLKPCFCQRQCILFLFKLLLKLS